MGSQVKDRFEERSIKIALMEANSAFRTNTKHRSFDSIDFSMLITVVIAAGLTLVFLIYK
jgi:hypothetical protein